MKLSFKLCYTDEEPGGDRQYEVVRFGRIIGTVSNDWAPHPTIIGGTPVRWWYFTSVDGRRGDGKSRAAAVEAAIAVKAQS